MAKKPAKAIAAEAIEKAATTSSIGVRGPKGVDLTAVVTVTAAGNPKRAGSASYERFNLYQDGMTVEAALAAGVTTPDLVYDAAHNFISIAGYTPAKMFEAKPKKEKVVKEPKAKKVKAPKSAEAVAAESELESAVNEETID